LGAFNAVWIDIAGGQVIEQHALFLALHETQVLYEHGKSRAWGARLMD